ncbi:hypothetical protein [Candidatus Amarolinea dominans]|uniref:hypothetical protein n=1 Tax=Candidatus Amarolinea dominans TaxID=3140696 RepID=UPI001E0DA2D3|nr:hypothetical protein [Anaerolineae bacterium]
MPYLPEVSLVGGQAMLTRSPTGHRLSVFEQADAIVTLRLTAIHAAVNEGELHL